MIIFPPRKLYYFSAILVTMWFMRVLVMQISTKLSCHYVHVIPMQMA